MSYTIIIIANYLYRTWANVIFTSQKRTGAVFLAVFALGGCSALPDKPTRATVYDFGPGAVALQPASRQASSPVLPALPVLPTLPTLALDEVQAGAALDSTAVLYRLAYADAQALRPYAQARWSMTPAQLLRQRLREHLGQRRAVLNAADGSASTAPILLRIELEEFSQLFETPSISTGLLRLRATALQPSSQGERLLGQRSFTVQRPSPSADATGGVRALTAASDAAIEEIDLWLQQLR